MKQYYLADHLHFLDTFLKSRQSKGNIVTEVEVTEEGGGGGGDEEEEEEAGGGEEDDTQSSTQGANDPITANQDTPKPNTSLPPPTSEQKKDSGYRKRTRPSTSLSDVNSSALKYFEIKQRLLDQKSQSNSNPNPDPDLAFLHSILPDMKAMDSRQKRRFKMGVMQLTDDILKDTDVSPRNSLPHTASNRSSVTTPTFQYTSPSLDSYCTQDQSVLDLDQQTQEERNFNINNYLNFINK